MYRLINVIVEVVSIGEELLAGKVVDTNSSFLASEVKRLGFKCRFKTTVGDNTNDIHMAIERALSRSNLILITGGLGPTDDDLTISALASYFNTSLDFHEDIEKKIKGIFASRNLVMPESNIKQAYLPKGSEALPNPIGTAAGMLWDVSNLLSSHQIKLIMAFPGVPSEMEFIWKNSAIDYLKNYSHNNIHERYINFIGISESALVEKLHDFINKEDPVVLPYANNFMVQLRVYSENKDLITAKHEVEKVIERISALVGDNIFGFDDDTLESVIGKYLRERNLTVSIAESCTGGLISSRLTDVAGSSDYIKLNLITYSNESKIKVLNVPEEEIKNYGAVSQETVKSMAQGIRNLANTDIALSISGIAGPTGGTSEKPVGTAYISVCNKNQCFVKKISIGKEFSRSMIKFRFSQYALNCLRIFLLSNYDVKEQVGVIT